MGYALVFKTEREAQTDHARGGGVSTDSMEEGSHSFRIVYDATTGSGNVQEKTHSSTIAKGKKEKLLLCP
jgi:hypothetical protein